MSVEGEAIVRIEAVDHDGLAAWHASVVAAERADVGEAALVWALPEVRELLADSGSRRRCEAWALLHGGEVVTTGWLVLPQLTGRDRAELHVTTRPGHRRRGFASAMLAHLEDRARAADRTRLEAEVTWRYEHGADPAGVPGWELARTRGFAFGIGDVQRELRGQVPDPLLDDLAAAAAPQHTAYDLRSWSGPVPDELVAGWLALDSTLMTEAPAGAMEREPGSVDVAAHREAEALLVRQRRTAFHTVACDAAGAVVAYTLMVTTEHEPGRAYQWGTLVQRDHRGHRLGIAVKVANHRRLQAGAPQVRRVTTWNAEENAAMIGVNEQLGFVPVARLAELQQQLGRRG